MTDAHATQIDLIGTGGSLRKLTRSYVGPLALAGVEAHFADLAVFSPPTSINICWRRWPTPAPTSARGLAHRAPGVPSRRETS